MKRSTILPTILFLAVQTTPVVAYEAQVDVTFAFGGNYGGTANASSMFGATSFEHADIGWTAGSTSALAVLSDSTYFSAQSGYVARSYYNADYASTADCTPGSATIPDPNATGATRRKYGCRFTTYGGTPSFAGTPVTDAAPVLAGASASGTLNVTDTTLSGTLRINSTTDEPTGATTTFSPSGVRLSNTAGAGFSGFNYRSADGSPFGNYWQGVTTNATLTVNLTGTFTSSSWSITGGTVYFNDSGFACQQGGLGSTTDAAAGTLCTSSVGVSGGQSKTGSNLSWGVDPDGDGGTSTPTEIEVRSAVAGPIIETLSGVLATVTVDAGGNLTTVSGEFRRALGSSGGGCATYIVYDGNRISCGSLTVGRLQIFGTVNPPGGEPDTEPNPYAFPDVTNVPVSQVATSAPAVIVGINQPVDVNIVNGEYSVNCSGAYTSLAGTGVVANGDSICVRHVTAPSAGLEVVSTLSVGTGPSSTATFRSIALAADSDPDVFYFTDQEAVPLSTIRQSNAVTITGVNVPAAISAVGGTYSIGCSGTFTAAPGTVSNGQTVCVRHSSASTFTTATNTTLTVGSVSDTFTSTTVPPPDTTPDAFVFVDQASVPVGLPVTSNAVTISGLTAAASVSVSGGEYSIGCDGSFTSAPGTIANNQSICLRHVAASTLGTSTDTTLTIGGIADIFTSTTAETADEVPAPFAFVDQSDVPKLAVIVSLPVTITGITVPAPVTISGGQYSVGCTTAYTSAPGTVLNGQQLCVRHTSAAAGGATTSTTLEVGGVADTFTSTTSTFAELPGQANVAVSFGGNHGGTADPNSAFGMTTDTSADISWTANGTSALAALSDSLYFTAQSGYNSRSYYDADYASAADCTPGSATIPDPNATGATRRKYGCRFSTSGGTPTFAGTAVSGNAVALAGASASGTLNVTDTTLTGTLRINSTTDEPTGATTTFSPSGVRLSNTAGAGFSGFNYRSADGSPFGNYWQGVTTAATLTVNLTGTFTSSSWSITGGTVYFNDSGFACQQGGLGSTTDAAAGTLCTSSVGVAGGQSKTGSNLSWGVDPDGDGGTSTPTEIEVRSAVAGPIIETLSGVLATVTVDAGGNLTTVSGEFRRALGSSGAGCAGYIVYDGQRVSCGTLTTGRLQISGTFAGPIPGNADVTPDPFVFTDRPSVTTDTTITSNAVTISGLDSTAQVSVTNGSFSIGCDGNFGNLPATIADDQSICVRHTSASSVSTTVDTTLTVGTVSETFSSTTRSWNAADDTAVTNLATPVTIPVLLNDVGFSDPVVAGLFNAPSHGTVTVNGSPGSASGVSLVYTPTSGFAGVDSFEYSVDDQVRQDFATVTVTVIPDFDGDGIDDSNADNCIGAPNPDQRDADGDGYGSLCDADLDNNGFVNFADVGIFRTRFGTSDPVADFNGSGLVNFSDLGILRSRFGKAPGPSALKP